TVYAVAYVTALSKGTVEVAGRPPAIAASTNWRPLSQRRLLLGIVAAAGMVGAIYARPGYEGRHMWFAQHGHGSLVLWTAVAAAVFVTFALAGATLAQRARGRGRMTGPAILAAVSLIGTLLAYAGGRPSRASA